MIRNRIWNAEWQRFEDVNPNQPHPNHTEHTVPKTERLPQMHDFVTLVQLDQGACFIAECLWCDHNNTYNADYEEEERESDKRSRKRYHYKVTPNLAYELRKGDYLIVNHGAHINAVIFDKIAEDFTPQPGITYRWGIGRVSREDALALDNVDKCARKRIHLAEAKRQARAAVSEDDVKFFLPKPNTDVSST